MREDTADVKIRMIGNRLRDIRIKKGYSSYVEFALEAQMQPKQYWKLEAGIANFTIRSLLRVLETFEMSLEEFFSDFESLEEDH